MATILERVASDKVYRRGIQETPSILQSHGGLTPEEAALMTAVVDSAYGIQGDVVSEYKLRVCAIADED